jgi:hypothetical protein
MPPVVTTVASSTTPAPTTTTVPPMLADPPPFDRWTAILASLPVDEYDDAAAAEEAFTYASAEPGLLRSDDYPSLNPGYWVVFSGDFATQKEALAHCRMLQEDDVFCYHRYLGEAPVLVAGRSEGTLVAWVDGVLAVVDAADGGVVEAVTDAYLDGGVDPGTLELGTDGTGAYFSVGFEDSWFSCEASAGRIDYVDLTSGEASEISVGIAPRLSPDGSRLAYVASSNCVPDPEDDRGAVVSYYDTVAVLDLVTGRVQTWGPSPGAARSPESLIASLAWNANGAAIFVAMEAGPLRRVDTNVGAPIDATPALGRGRADVDFGAWILEGIDAGSGRLVAVEVDYAAGRSRVIELDPASGEVLQQRRWRDGEWIARLDGTRTALLLSSPGVVTGAPVGDLGPDPFFTGADW